MSRAKSPYRIEWRAKAREDLRAIVRYIGQDNPNRARSFGRAQYDKTHLLAQYPELGHSGRPGLPDYVRELVAHPHYISFLPRAGEDPYCADFARETRGTTNTVSLRGAPQFAV